MGQILKSKPVRILILLIIIVTISNLILTLPQYLQKRQLQDEITADLELFQQMEITWDISLETTYKFNYVVAERELGIVKNIADVLDEGLAEEALNLREELRALNADLISLEKQILLLSLPQDISNREELLALFEQEIPNADELRTFLRDALQQRDNALESLRQYREAIEVYKREQVNAGNFVNELWGMSDREIKNMVETMSNEHKAAQLFMWSLNGTSLTRTELDNMSDMPPGGVILMGYNISGETQLKTFTKQIQSTNTIYPYFISTDQEGGVVKRVGWDKTAGATTWAGLNEEALCELAGTRSRILNSGGINVNLAPVVDLSVSGGGFINNRTISSDPQIVAAKAATFVNCSQDAKVFNVLKHYPGHGATAQDSHFTLPVINKDKETWLQSDAIPFKDSSAKMIMVGHLFFKQIDPDNPSTTSSILLDDILRQEMGYDGLLISDDMNLLQRSSGISYKDLIVDSLNAGMDILLYVGLPDRSERMIAVVSDALEKGELNRGEIENKVYRIMLAKRDLI